MRRFARHDKALYNTRMAKYLKSILIFANICCIPLVVSAAEVHECDGVWTNETCNGSISKEFSVSRSAEPSPERKELNQRKLWLHDLEMLRLKAKRDFGLSASIEHVRGQCLDLKVEAEVCTKLVAEREKEIQNLIIARQAADAEKEKAEKTSSDDSQKVVIIDNRGDEWNRRGVYVTDGRRRPGVDPYNRHPYGSGHHRHEHESTSAGVSVGVSSSTGNANLGITTGSRSGSSARSAKGFIGF